MIVFNDLIDSTPYNIFKNKYDLAIKSGQNNIEAASVSSYNTNTLEVDSRYVNIKFLNYDKFIFFSNYNSPKADAFFNNSQIAVVFFWNEINTQIRIKATIEKTSEEFNKNYFKKRSFKKNALSISSRQSREISSYEEVIERYQKIRKKSDLTLCPHYWGGFAFEPYQIEFWEGGKYRLNKRDFFTKNGKIWEHSVLEP